MVASRSPHFTENTWGQWAASLGIWSALFVFFMEYHVVRGRTWEWFTANKCIAIASTFTLGLALALGPLSHWRLTWRRFLPWRRSLGVVGALMVVPHVVLSLTVLHDRFPWSWYAEHLVSTAFAIMAASLLLVGAAISSGAARRWLGEYRWAWWQSTMWWMLGLVLLHLAFSGKALGWLKWFQTFDKPLPPGASTATVFALLVLGLHLAQRLEEFFAARG